MLKILCTVLLCAVAGAGVSAQQLDLSKDALKDEAALAKAILNDSYVRIPIWK